MTTKNKRLFIAIPLPENVRKGLLRLGSIIEHPAIRWIPEQNLHVTLHFIGETQPDEMQPIIKNISNIAAENARFKMMLDELRVIKRNGNPSMIWAALNENETFTKLALQFQNLLPGDSRKSPVPHITLARIKSNRKVTLPELPELVQADIEVDSIELMESKPGKNAPVYDMLKKFELKRQ